MENQFNIEELYPHLFMNNAKFIVNSMLKVDEEASRIKSKAMNRNEDFSKMTIEEKQAIAFQCIEENRIREKEHLKLSQAKSMQKKHLREYDPRIGIEERHMKVQQKKQNRIEKMSAEEKLQELREQRQRLIEEISPEDLEKAKKEVKETAENIRNQDLINKKKLREMYEKEKIEKKREELIAEKEKNQRILIIGKTKRFFNIILEVFTHNKKKNLFFGFKSINKYAITLATTSLKIKRKYRSRRLFKNFHKWKEISMKIKLHEEMIIFQQEQEKMVYLEQIAQKNYEFWLKRKIFECFERYVEIVRMEKENQIEIQKRNKKLQNFMNFVKQRTEEEFLRKQAEEILEKNRKEREKEEMIQLEFELQNAKKEAENERNKEKYTKHKKITHEIAVETESFHDFNELKDKKEEKDEEIKNDISNIPQESLKSEKSVEDKQESPEIKLKTPKVSKEFLKMQQRTEERKQKREALEAKYKEKKEREEKERQEAIIKAQNEEKMKKKELINKRKQEERIKKENEMKKFMEQEELTKKFEFAEKHYQKKLIIKITQKWVNFYYSNIDRNEYLINTYEMNKKRKYWCLLIKGMRLIRRENLEIQAQKMEKTYLQYLMNLRNKIFYKLKNFFYETQEKELEYFKVRTQYLKKSVFQAWSDLIPELMDENYEADKRDNEKIMRFRSKICCPKVFRAWKDSVQISKEEKLKELYTQSLWEKAQLWLSEANIDDP